MSICGFRHPDCSWDPALVDQTRCSLPELLQAWPQGAGSSLGGRSVGSLLEVFSGAKPGAAYLSLLQAWPQWAGSSAGGSSVGSLLEVFSGAKPGAAYLSLLQAWP